ncbi:hypothetical protein OEA41_004745 [Lepraria neglecta]|uniref:Anaphase-promoting complex subunit 4 n=1 Tax=Lepraria neglecta TaxID=209136 RepID=A0AAE0DII7_9LECA|nr:hypothetical protein OEA41_004745 [Lepraria neglecta]
MAEPLAEKVVQPAINPSHVAYCPTMDLIALATIDEHIHIYRLNGQKVFGVQTKQPSAKVDKIKWKPNGQSLAAAYSNHFLTLTNAQTCKVVHQIDCSAYSKSPICCLGWGANFTDSNKVSQQINKLKGELSLDDVISHNPQTKAIDSVPDLPLDLAFLDVEASLPKLSVLSSGGIDSRASLDTLFQPLTTGSTDSADILVVGFEDGTVHLSIFDSFEIGSFSLQQASRGFQICRPLLHSSHPYSTTHSLLVSSSTGNIEELYVVPLDLRLLSNAGRYLSLLAAKSTQLHNVLRYIHQVQRQMYSDFKASQVLPRKFIVNVEEALQEQSDCTWVQAAYHLVVTGNCYPEVKEWLVDQLAERGHKRWEKATTTGYESVRRLAHENLLPALERFAVIVSRLRGLSKFQVSNVTLGLSTQDLDNILDTVNCLQLVGHRILIASGSELRQFQAFSAWLRQEIENQSTDASSTDSPEKDTNVDHASTLEYIQGAMTQSELTRFFDLEGNTDQSLQWDLKAEGRSLFELYKRELKLDNKDDPATKRLPAFDALLKHLDTQCNAVFSSIAETQKRNVRFGSPTSLGVGTPACMDMRMLVENPEETGKFVTYVILGPSTKQLEVHVYRITFEIENGMSSTKGVKVASIRTAALEVRDVKFIDDDELMLAASDKTSSRLIRIPYRKMGEAPNGLQYTVVADHDGRKSKSQAEQSNSTPSIDLSDPEDLNACTWQEFPAGVSWTPERLEVNGRKGRRVICVLAQDRFHYRVYDLDTSSETQNTRTEGSDDVML